jgi:hypothetical protein
MKNKRIMVATLIVILIGIVFFVACNKEDTIQDVVTNTNSNSSVANKNWIVTLKLGFATVAVEGNFHRQIYERPRDGKICDCKDCFGICILNINFEMTNNTSGLLDFDIDNETATLYFIKDLKQAEEEFGVDEPVFISKENLPNKIVEKYSIQSGITILPNMYKYEDENIGLIYKDDTLSCYGKTKLNIRID